EGRGACQLEPHAKAQGDSQVQGCYITFDIHVSEKTSEVADEFNYEIVVRRTVRFGSCWRSAAVPPQAALCQDESADLSCTMTKSLLPQPPQPHLLRFLSSFAPRGKSPRGTKFPVSHWPHNAQLYRSLLTSCTLSLGNSFYFHTAEYNIRILEIRI
ncbi:unnamed protein product, partial [Nesidiocoris tenuis]